jgi:putative membrane protein
MLAFLSRWAITAAALALAAELIGGIWFGGDTTGRAEL